MEFRIEAAPRDGGWTMRAVDASGTPLLDKTGQPCARVLQAAPTKTFDIPLIYPALSADDLAALDGAAPHRTLCGDADAVATAHRAIVHPAKYGPFDLETFGRYLFEIAVGQEWWLAMNAAAGVNQTVELSLA